MSISVRIPFEGREKYFSLVTSDTYNRFWLPGANALSLYWVKQFNSCLLCPGNHDAICSELRCLRKWFYENYSQEVAAALSKSIDDVLPAIESLENVDGYSIWIG